MRRIRVLTWHVHGNYLLYLSRTNVELYLPVKPGCPEGYGGRGTTFPFPDRVVDVPAESVRDLDFDCVLFQTRKNYEIDQFELLSEAERRLPRIYLEHDPPRAHPTDTRHWFDAPDGLLVHVTPFNALMWDSGRTPTRVIDHGVFIPEGVQYSGEIERGIVVINHLRSRGRLLGADIFCRAREQVPLDLVGMDSDSLGGVGEIQPMQLPAFEARYRFFFNPIRWTSLGLAVIEAMTMGMPIVGLATTEMATAVENGVSGFVDTDFGRLVEAMNSLLDDRSEARRLGEGARRYALDRFHIDRFAANWEETFSLVTGRARPGRTRVAPRPGAGKRSYGMKMKRVALISEHASPLALLGGVDSGGQNVYVGQLAVLLANFGYQVDVFTRRDHADLPDIASWGDHARIIHVPAGPAAPMRKEELLPFMGEFADFVIRCNGRRQPYDLVHANFFMSALVAAELKRVAGVPFVVTFHALGRVRRRHQGVQDAFPDERLAIEDRAVREADRIIAECPEDAEDLINLYRADPALLATIPCGFDPAEFWPMGKARARRAIGLDLNERIVLQLGRMVPRKGVDNVIRGLARLRCRQGVSARLLVVGGDSESPDPRITPEIGRLKGIAETEGIADLVTFVGSRCRDLLRYYYCAADIFVTTPWYEPFGITPVEAAACGTPVVGASVGGIKTTVVDGETGYLVPPHDPDALADRLGRLFRDPQLAQRLGRQAVHRANACFTWRKVAGEVARVYAEVIESRPMRTVRRLPRTILVPSSIGSFPGVMVAEEVEWR